jgi:hypothetical protein
VAESIWSSPNDALPPQTKARTTAVRRARRAARSETGPRRQIAAQTACAATAFLFETRLFVKVALELSVLPVPALPAF